MLAHFLGPGHDHCQHDGQHQDKGESSVHKESATPADLLDEQRRGDGHDDAGERNAHCRDTQRSSAAGVEPVRHQLGGREAAHRVGAEADERCEDQIELPLRRDHGQEQEAQAHGQRTNRDDAANGKAIKRFPDKGCEQATDDIDQGQAERDIEARASEICSQRLEEHPV